MSFVAESGDYLKDIGGVACSGDKLGTSAMLAIFVGVGGGWSWRTRRCVQSCLKKLWHG